MTFFAWLAIAVGVAAMGSLLSVMYGFEASLRDKVLNAFPHVLVQSPQGMPITGQEAFTEQLRKLPTVRRVVPVLESEMVLQARSRAIGAVVRGVRETELAEFKAGLVGGALPSATGHEPEALVGVELAHRLDLEPGDTVRLVSPTRRSGALGSAPLAHSFRVAGLYASGHYEFDQQYLFVLLGDMQDLLNKPDALSAWHLWADRLDDSERLLAEVRAIVPQRLEAQSWREFNAALFQSLQLEQWAMFLVLSFAVAIAVMNVVITLLMHVVHKRRNIGVFRAIGATRADVRAIFVWQGAWLGAAGLFFGALLTVLFVVYVRKYSGYLLPDIYYDRTIPVELRPWAFVTIYGVAMVMIGVATLYPSAKAASVDPMDAIRE